MSDISTLHTRARGVCPDCGQTPLLAPDGLLIFHSALLDGFGRLRCSGTGAAPESDPGRLEALAEYDRHVPDPDGRCHTCDPPTLRHHRPVWPCPARRAAWDAFAAARVPA